MADENKRGFFDRIKEAVDQIIPGTEPAKKPAGAPLRRPPASAVGVDGFKRTVDLARPKHTAGLNEAKPTGRLAEQGSGPTEADLSPRRLAMIGDYAKGEFKLEQMKDPAYMYKIVSDERAYQTRLLFEWRKQLQALPAGSPKALELQEKIKTAQAIATNLFKVLKRITGAEGNTGGTDFLSDKK
jgi:hypothetical protein